MNRTWLLLVLLSVNLHLHLISSSGKVVKLKLLTTSCRSSCWHYHDDKCPSSIKVDGKELSHQKDGFNIVVLDSNTGKVTKRKHIRWYNNLVFGTKSEFIGFFRSVRFNSTVIVTFQNMCKSFNENWYTYLSGLNNNIRKQYYAYQAIVVACKGPCPKAAEPYIGIPYTYYNAGRRFAKSITLLFGDAKAPPSKRRKQTNSTDSGGSIGVIGGIIGGTVLLFTMLYAGYMYYNRRNEHQRSAVYSTGTGSNFYSASVPLSPPTYDEACQSLQRMDAPIYEELQLHEQEGDVYQTLPQDVEVYAEPSVMYTEPSAYTEPSDSNATHRYDIPAATTTEVVPSVQVGSVEAGDYDGPGDFHTHEYEECADFSVPSSDVGGTATTDSLGYQVMTGGDESSVDV